MDQRAGADCGPQGRTGPSSATREAASRPGYVTALEIAPPAPGASAPLGATASDGGVNFSVFPTPPSRHTSFLSIRRHTGLITTGMSVCPASSPVKSMATGQRGRMRRTVDSDSTPTSCSSIRTGRTGRTGRTAVRARGRRAARLRPQGGREARQQRRDRHEKRRDRRDRGAAPTPV